MKPQEWTSIATNLLGVALTMMLLRQWIWSLPFVPAVLMVAGGVTVWNLTIVEIRRSVSSVRTRQQENPPRSP